MTSYEQGCRLYSERNGMRTVDEVEALFAPPEVSLLPEERAAAYAFAGGLFEGTIITPEGQVIQAEAREGKLPSLEQIDKANALSPINKFYLGYFDSNKGREHLPKLGISSGISLAELPAHLCDIESVKQASDSGVRKEVATASLKWLANRVAERLEDDAAGDATFTEDGAISVNYEPEKLIAKLENLQAYRRFYRDARGALRQSATSPLVEAERTILNVYNAKVNFMVASLYPAAAQLIEQVERSAPTPEAQAWRQRLSETLPVIRFLFTEDRALEEYEHTLETFGRKLDLLRMGAAEDEAGNFTPLSSQLKHLARHYESEAPQSGTSLPEAVLKYVKETDYSAEQMKPLFEAVLEKWDLLSEEQADYASVKEREGAAADGKWQVVIDPNRSSHETASKQKVIYVPSDFERKLGAVSAAGALPVAAHELTHVLQAEFGDKLSAILPLAKIKGRRTLTVQELGTIHQERLVHAMLGQARPTQFIYEQALEAKETGGNLLQVARAFLASKAGTPSKQTRTAAARNSLRLYRKGGHDSQPLDYSEQELVNQVLKERSEDEFRSLTIAGTSFSFAESAALQRVGLLNSVPEVAEKPAETVMKVFLEQLLPEELRRKID